MEEIVPMRALVGYNAAGLPLTGKRHQTFGMKTRIFNAAGAMVADADVTKCNVTAAGAIITSTAPGCDAANTLRIARGDDRERPSRLWRIKFGKASRASDRCGSPGAAGRMTGMMVA